MKKFLQEFNRIKRLSLIVPIILVFIIIFNVDHIQEKMQLGIFMVFVDISILSTMILHHFLTKIVKILKSDYLQARSARERITYQKSVRGKTFASLRKILIG